MTAPAPDDPAVRSHAPGPSAQPGAWEPEWPATPPPGHHFAPGGQPFPPGGHHFPSGGQPFPPGGYVVRPGYGLPAVSPSGAPLASFGDRLLAYLIDAAVFMGIGVVLAIPLVVVLFAVLEPDFADPDGVTFADTLLLVLLLEAIVLVIVAVISYFYYVELMRRQGQTLGKRVMKLRVVPLDPTVALDRGHCVRRWLIQFGAGSVVPFFSYLDGFWQLWDKPYQQCLHDKWARTVVVKAP